MKIVEETYLIATGAFSKSPEFEKIRQEILEGIKLVTNPPDNKLFIINPTPSGNGIAPIKKNLIKHLHENDWNLENRATIVNGVKERPGAIDAVKLTSYGLFAVEWETGNISSSHRALNKIAVGIIERNLIGGILILPERELYKYLTDRVGNYREMKPYFLMYKNLNIQEGVIGVFSMTYDGTSSQVPLIKRD